MATDPAPTLLIDGPTKTDAGVTETIAGPLVARPSSLLAITEYRPASEGRTLSNGSVAEYWFGIRTPSWYQKNTAGGPAAAPVRRELGSPATKIWSYSRERNTGAWRTTVTTATRLVTEPYSFAP